MGPHLYDHMVHHFIPTQAGPNDDGVKALQPVLDRSQRLVINLLLLVFWQLHPHGSKSDTHFLQVPQQLAVKMQDYTSHQI